MTDDEIFLDEPYKHELLGIIQERIDRHERSAQVEPGPSEIGGCDRKLVWKLLYGADGKGGGGYAAYKGTCVHEDLDKNTFGWHQIVDGVVAKIPGPRYMPDGSQRFFSNLSLPKLVAPVAGGTLDLYDKLYQTIIDFKCPGDGTMDKARASNLARGYRVQGDVYGEGAKRMGFDVARVGLLYLPMCGDNLHDKAVLRLWYHNPARAWDHLRKVEKYQTMINAGGNPKKILELAPTLSDFCQSCPVYVGNGDRRAMCPGSSVSNRVVDTTNDPFAR